MTLWVAHWVSGGYDIDYICEAESPVEAMYRVKQTVESSGLVPSSDIAMAPLQPFKVNQAAFMSAAAKN